MNKVILMLAATLLAACAKRSEAPSTTAAPLALARSFMSIQDHEAEAFLKNQLIRGHGLSAKETIRCKAERPKKIADLCMLAWARSGEQSSELTDTLKSSFLESPTLSLALLFTPQVIARLDLHRLQKFISNLEKFPSWIRAMALDAWLGGRENLSPAEQDELRLQLSALTDDFPLTQKIKFKLARKHLPGTLASWHARYCSPLLTGMAKVRCWRHLSAVDAGRSELQSLPPVGSEWKLFERAMPYRALLLKERLHQEAP